MKFRVQVQQADPETRILLEKSWDRVLDVALNQTRALEAKGIDGVDRALALHARAKPGQLHAFVDADA